MSAIHTCADCEHYCAIAKECRAKSPTVVSVLTPQGALVRTWGVFPPTNPTNWCGDFSPGVKVLN